MKRGLKIFQFDGLMPQTHQFLTLVHYIQSSIFGGIIVVCSWGTFDSKHGNCKHIFYNNMAEVNNKLA